MAGACQGGRAWVGAVAVAVRMRDGPAAGARGCWRPTCVHARSAFVRPALAAARGAGKPPRAAPMHARDLSPRSILLAEGAWKVHLRDQLGDHRLDEIGVRDVERWAHARLDSGAGEAALEKAWQLLGKMRGRAVAWGWLERNPVRLATRPRKRNDRRRGVALSPPEVEAVRSHLGDRDSALVSLLAYGGLRPGEALALKWSDIGATHIEVTKALSLGIAGRTKTGRTRRVPMLPCLREDLVAWRLRSERSADTDLVFPNHEGLPWSEPTRRQWAGRSLRPALAKAGISGVRTYDLRHTNASLLIASGISIVEVAPSRARPEPVPRHVRAHRGAVRGQAADRPRGRDQEGASRPGCGLRTTECADPAPSTPLALRSRRVPPSPPSPPCSSRRAHGADDSPHCPARRTCRGRRERRRSC